MAPERTRSAIFSSSADLLTMYGISVTMMTSRPFSITSMVARARTEMSPRPVV